MECRTVTPLAAAIQARQQLELGEHNLEQLKRHARGRPNDGRAALCQAWVTAQRARYYELARAAELEK